MLSRSRCVSRAFSRSLSAFQKGSPYARDQVTLTAGRLSLTTVSSVFAFSELQLYARMTWLQSKPQRLQNPSQREMSGGRKLLETQLQKMKWFVRLKLTRHLCRFHHQQMA
ncbi:DLST isoform 9 [Pongo abelii]|uniref:DLST isoform 9 n=1 Tax=Pongo abelii TaxID=9601 RepID=A0A2J8T3X4_PONAB|nr:DLST isoform 9 [Pongo abelii]